MKGKGNEGEEETQKEREGNKNGYYDCFGPVGSMSAVRSDTIGGFNQFLLDQQKNNPNATLTMVQFDNEYEPVHRAEQRVAMPRRTIPRLITSFPTKTGMTKKNI